jgi:predicted pyridoxine 5'-phosphate oxidase superfamily flavin-nucleotide-binding protein
MNAEVLGKVLELAEKVSYLSVASVDRDGMPHMASTDGFTLASEDRVILTEWFCATTVSNLQQNPRLAILIWDQVRDVGYQLLGKVERIRDLSILDGFVPEAATTPFPQVEREVVVHVEQVLRFSHAPHRDEPV